MSLRELLFFLDGQISHPSPGMHLSMYHLSMYPCIHVPCIYPCTMYSSIYVFTHIACIHLSMYLPIPTLEAFPFIPTCDPNQVGFHPNLGCSSQIISQPSKDGIVGSSEVRTELDLHPKLGRSWIFIPSWDAIALSFNMRSQVGFHPNAGCNCFSIYPK